MSHQGGPFLRTIIMVVSNSIGFEAKPSCHVSDCLGAWTGSTVIASDNVVGHRGGKHMEFDGKWRDLGRLVTSKWFGMDKKLEKIWLFIFLFLDPRIRKIAALDQLAALSLCKCIFCSTNKKTHEKTHTHTHQHKFLLPSKMMITPLYESRQNLHAQHRMCADCVSQAD